MFVGVADDEADAGQRRDFFRSALCVASGHYDSCFRILAANAADRGARILVRAGGHGAGIHHDYGGLRRSRGACDTVLLELAFEGGAVSLSGAAAKVLYIVSGHVSYGNADFTSPQDRQSQKPRARAPAPHA